MKKITDKSVIIKHSAIVQMSNEVTRHQRVAFNIMLYNAYDSLLTKRVHEIKITDLKKHLDIKEAREHNMNIYIKKMIHQLGFRGVTINILGKSKNLLENSRIQEAGFNIKKDDELTLSLFQAIKTNKSGIISYEFNPYLADFLYNPDIYSKIKLSMQQKFLNKYSIALYEICLDYKGVFQTSKIKLGDLKSLLLGNQKRKSYKEFFVFNRAVLKPAIKNINEDTDIFITPEFIKKGRKVVAVKFKIKNNDKIDLDNKQTSLIDKIYKKEIEESEQISKKGMQSIQDILGNKQFTKKEVQDSPTNNKDNEQHKENKEKVEFFVNTILNFTNHKDSINFYRKVAWAFVLSKKQESIYETIRAIEVDYRGKTVNKAKLFNTKIRESAKARKVDLG